MPIELAHSVLGRFIAQIPRLPATRNVVGDVAPDVTP
jgi:hypothetical protein